MLAIQVGVFPWRRPELEPAEGWPGNIPGRHLADKVIDRATGDRRPEPIRMANDPAGQVTAVRAACHAQAIGIGPILGDQAVDARQDVAHRPGAPVPEVRPIERLAVTLGAAWVGGPHADPGSGQDLPLPERAPAVERMRAAVDLHDERRRTRTAPPPPAAGDQGGSIAGGLTV